MDESGGLENRCRLVRPWVRIPPSPPFVVSFPAMRCGIIGTLWGIYVRRRGARVDESTCLESTRAGNGTVGSNPTLSAACLTKNQS